MKKSAIATKKLMQLTIMGTSTYTDDKGHKVLKEKTASFI